MQSRQLWVSATATGQQFFDMPSNSKIRGVVFAVTPTSFAAAADYIELEVSTQNSNQTAVADAQNIVAVMSCFHPGSGTPASLNSANHNFYSPADFSVKAGERVYLNYTESGNSTWRVRCVVWFD